MVVRKKIQIYLVMIIFFYSFYLSNFQNKN